MRRSWGLFPFDVGEYKAAQAWLDQRADRGWRLKRVYLNHLAVFEQAERPSHFVDVDMRKALDGEPDPDYLQLCSDSGWELVQTLRGMLLFRAKEGMEPVPIQTDGGMEWDRFRRKSVKSMAVAAIFFLGLMLWCWLIFSLTGGRYTVGRSLLGLPISNAMMLETVCFAVMLAVLVWQGAATVCYFRRCQRAGTMVTPSVRMCQARGAVTYVGVALFLVGWLALLLEGFGLLGVTVELRTDIMREENTATAEACRPYPVVMACDLGLDDREEKVSSRYLNGRRSVLMDSLDYSELLNGPEGETYIITCQRYACRWEWLARWCAGQKREETRQGAFLWGELHWEEAALPGFDESYSCRDNGYLLLRAGKTVALVGCSQGVDLTAAEIQAMLWDRLNF